MNQKQQSDFIEVPVDIIDKLKEFAKDNNFGMFAIGSDKFNLMLIGVNFMNPQSVAILAADALLQGVINGGFVVANELSQEQPKGSVN